jgi:hypothetical protein
MRIMYEPHSHPSWYPPAGYDYAPYGPPPNTEFVGAPPVVTYVPEQPFPVATVVGIVVAGAVAAYFIYSASKAGGRVQKRMNRAAMRILGDEAKRQGAAAVRHLGDAAGSMFMRAVDRHATGRHRSGTKPRIIHYEAVPVTE